MDRSEGLQRASTVFRDSNLAVLFQNRSGRVVSASRLVLAVIFLLSLLLARATGGDGNTAAICLMAGYIVISAGVVGLTWQNWWRDYQLALPAHVLDILVFGSVVLVTSGYASPFYTFSVFLLLSAMIQWGWRGTWWTTAAVVALFLLGGLITSLRDEVPLEVDRVLIRTAYLLILSVLMIWFVVLQESSRRPLAHISDGIDHANDHPSTYAVRAALKEVGGETALLAWAEIEEPWVHVTRFESDTVIESRLSPDESGETLSTGDHDRAYVFNIPADRALTINSDGQVESTRPPGFLKETSAIDWPEAGLLVRIRSATYVGELVVTGTKCLSRDNLLRAEIMGRGLSSLFDRYALLSSHAEDAVERAKASLARDLHDSVVQSLSGANFRLEALRSWIKAGRPADEEIAAIQNHLITEQRNVRSFIARLQSGQASSRPVDLVASIGGLLDQLCAQWKIQCNMIQAVVPIQAPSWMNHTIRQIVREAIANAVRHGGATRIECALEAGEEELSLTISDNGGGFAMLGSFDEQAITEKGLTPWSIYERTKSVGGSVSLYSQRAGSQLQIKFPGTIRS
jgi:signal transduction histidine kinase